jgi:hypothetical protein
MRAAPDFDADLLLKPFESKFVETFSRLPAKQLLFFINFDKILTKRLCRFYSQTQSFYVILSSGE